LQGGDPAQQGRVSDPLELAPGLVRRILDRFGCTAGRAEIRQLNRLIDAYVQTVPWESASRIARCLVRTAPADRVRWPEEFWEEALGRGTGGTCFESNLAFFSLLRSLGYEGYLTINDMDDTAGCHSAIVVRNGVRRHLADVGIPIYRALIVDPTSITKARTPFHLYFVLPDGPQRYQVERSDHPKRNVYTFVDVPVTTDAYYAATIQDYGEQGLFLDRVIVNRIVGGRQWRFSSGELPLRIQGFDRRGRSEVLLERGRIATTVARHFGIDETTLRTALAATGCEE
jgi:arylamine N-acetyltransferase